MKKYLSILLRKLALAAAADRLRFKWVQMKKKKQNLSFSAQNPSFVFPPDYFIYETYALSYKDYYEDGYAAAEVVMKLTAPYLDFNEMPISILDWGCGPGRVVRHLPGLAGEKHDYAGCDYNEAYVQWCTANIKAIRFFKNELSPPLQVNDNSLDLVYGLSILTHLSEQEHYNWMEEFFRVLKPGGILLLSTHGDACAIKLTQAERAEYDKGNFTERTFFKEGHRLYSSFQPPKFMERLTEKFVLLEFIPGGNESIGMQDCRILQKPFNRDGNH